MLTLSKRESRIVWGFLVAATVSEVIAVAFMFQPKGSWIDSLLRYCVSRFFRRGILSFASG